MTINETSFFRDVPALRSAAHRAAAEDDRGPPLQRARCASGARPAPPARRPTSWPCCCSSTFPCWPAGTSASKAPISAPKWWSAPGRPLSPHRDQPRPAGALRGALLRSRRRGLDREAGGAQAVQLPPGQPVRPDAAFQSRRRSVRRDLPAQRDALFFAGDAAHLLAGIRSSCSRRTACSFSAPASNRPIPRSGPRCWPAERATSSRGKQANTIPARPYPQACLPSRCGQRTLPFRFGHDRLPKSPRPGRRCVKQVRFDDWGRLATSQTLDSNRRTQSDSPSDPWVNLKKAAGRPRNNLCSHASIRDKLLLGTPNRRVYFYATNSQY